MNETKQLRQWTITTAGVCLLIASLPPPSPAEILTVPSKGMESISRAMIHARKGDTVLVSGGVYRERVMITSGVTLKARSLFKAVICAQGRGNAVTMGKNTAITGFEVRDGTVGIYSDDVNNAITRCRVVKNWQCGMFFVNNLPRIEDNVVAYNLSTGIYLQNITTAEPLVNHNTIAFNGGHGIAVEGRSSVPIQNNIIAFNRRFGLSLGARTERKGISYNDFFGNQLQAKDIPMGNFAFAPVFIDAKKSMNFMLDPRATYQHKGSDEQNLGARLSVYE